LQLSCFLPLDGNQFLDWFFGWKIFRHRTAEILKALGKPSDKEHRMSLAGTLSGYARDGKVFTKTAPNTFGLLEFKSVQREEEELPEEFGTMAR
jgi:hypothetical protein